MNMATQYWIPSDMPESLRVALAIRGNPPRTLLEHRARVEDRMEQLARQLEEEEGQGAAYRELVRQMPSLTMDLQETMPLSELVELMLESEEIQAQMTLSGGLGNPELQSMCATSSFRESLRALRNQG
jgi:hypothetical protein